MAYFIDIKRNIQQYFGSKGTITDHRPGIVGDLSKPKSIGLFFCISTLEELNMIRALLRHAKQRNDHEVKAYVFSKAIERIDVITDHSIIYFDMNDFTLTGRKKDQIVRIFEKDRSELFISFLTDPGTFCYKLASEIHADFKD